jgi:DNA-binding response OmpR family regulator
MGSVTDPRLSGAGPGCDDVPVRVLLVEDDDAVAESLRRGLGRYGFEVEWVRTGRDALMAATPDLVLLDLGLPDADGLMFAGSCVRQARYRSL